MTDVYKRQPERPRERLFSTVSSPLFNIPDPGRQLSLIHIFRRSNAQSNLSSASDKEIEALARFFLAQHHPASAAFTAKSRQQQGESAGPQADPPPSTAAHSPHPLCPRCGAPMVRRRATRGPNAGKEFYGCTNYPRCRGIVNIDQ